MSDLIKAVAVATGINAVIVALVLALLIFFGRALLGQGLAWDLERYKARLRAANDAEMERLRVSLRSVAFEHETRFSRLHERRIDVIAALYTHLTTIEERFHFLERASREVFREPSRFGRLQTAVRAMVTGLPGDAEDATWDQPEAAMMALEDCRAYLSKHRFWFDDALCAAVDHFQDRVWEVATECFRHTAGVEAEDMLSWEEMQAIAREDLLLLRRTIERQLRALLGVEDVGPLPRADAGG